VANVHILERSGASFRVVYHIAVPAGANAAGLAWSDALVKSGLGGTTVLPDGTGNDGGIAPAEKTAIEAGTVYEVVEQVPMSDSVTGAAIGPYLDALHAAKLQEAQADLSGRLRQFGRVR
jgi:hypothetical protein